MCMFCRVYARLHYLLAAFVLSLHLPLRPHATAVWGYEHAQARWSLAAAPADSEYSRRKENEGK